MTNAASSGAESASDEIKLNTPRDGAFYQQEMKAWNPILHPVWVSVTLVILGAIFLPVGFKIKQISDSVVEIMHKYDSHDISENLECAISTPNQNRTCSLAFEAPEDMEPPILVYYEIENFYQNHRNYMTSLSQQQLYGSSQMTTLEEKNCEPLRKLGNTTLNPCGLVANTLFNDVIKVEEGKDADGGDLIMLEDGIAWSSDLEFIYNQPEGFVKEKCNDCDNCSCDGEDWSCEKPYEDVDGVCYRYYYPDDNTTQYLYETYPLIINPLEGVTNEHFVVWMRIAALPHFRKLYGYFEKPIKKGETVTFKIIANWDVRSFKGSKSLVLTTTSMFGGKNPALGYSFIGVGGFCLLCGILFGLKHYFKPRKLGDKKYLRYKEE